MESMQVWDGMGRNRFRQLLCAVQTARGHRRERSGDSEKADPEVVDTGGGRGVGREYGGLGSPLPQVRCGGL